MEKENQKTLNESIISIKVKLQEANLKKSGVNKFQGFTYFELSDFLPTLNKLMNEEKVNDIFTINENEAKLILIKKDEKQEYTIPFKMFPAPQKMQPIQYLGALNTYYRRYLYLNAFGITEVEEIDHMDSQNLQKQNLNENNSIESKLKKIIIENKISNEIVLEELKKLGYTKLKEIKENQVATFLKNIMNKE